MHSDEIAFQIGKRALSLCGVMKSRQEGVTQIGRELSALTMALMSAKPTKIPNVHAVMNRDEVVTWLTERLENCQNIAATKDGKDRDGWLEDASCFANAIRLLTETQN
jgi:hypothetical protein